MFLGRKPELTDPLDNPDPGYGDPTGSVPKLAPGWKGSGFKIP